MIFTDKTKGVLERRIDSMVQDLPWGADNYYCDHKTCYWTLSWTGWIQFTHYFPKIHFNIILPSMPRSLTQSLPLKFSC